MPLFLFSCSVYMLPIVSPGSILSWYQAVRLCMNFGARVCPEMFLVGGWVLPELQQICGVQFGSGTNPGGHVTVSFGVTVIFCVDGPLEYFHTHLPHFRLRVSEILWPSLMHVGPDTFLSSGLHGIAAVDLEGKRRRQWQLFIYSEYFWMICTETCGTIAVSLSQLWPHSGCI